MSAQANGMDPAMDDIGSISTDTTGTCIWVGYAHSWYLPHMGTVAIFKAL